LVNHTVSFIGPNVAPCSLIAASNGNNSCGLNSFNLAVEDNVTVVSFEWNATQVNGFDTILLDSRAYTLALNTSGPVVPTPTPTPTPVRPSFSRCFCALSSENVTEAIINMTRLWYDHLLYTRLAVEDIVFNRTSISNGTVNRLYQNQDELGANFGVLYCEANGLQYAQILRRHIDSAVGVLLALLNNSDVTGPTNVALANAKEFATFWHAINPFAATDDVYNHMADHISTLAVLMQDLIAQNSTAIVTQMNIYTQATRDMTQYFIQAFRFQKRLGCSKNTDCCFNQCMNSF
jgi:hypothetical protein